MERRKRSFWVSKRRTCFRLVECLLLIWSGGERNTHNTSRRDVAGVLGLFWRRASVAKRLEEAALICMPMLTLFFIFPCFVLPWLAFI